MTDRNVTAQHAAEAGQTVFRLWSLTEFRDNPTPSSPVTGWLPEGSLVTMKEDAGPFLYVLTADGRLGYIADTAPVTLVHGPAPGCASQAGKEERSRRRDALVLIDKVQAEAEGARQPPVDRDFSAGVAYLVSAAIGLVGLLTAYAFAGMTRAEVGFFFAFDVLLPLPVLTADPKAPLVVYVLAGMAYLALLTVYVAI